MLNFAANLTMLFTELDFLDRFAAAARSGFRGVEYMFPYAYPKEQLSETLRKNGLTQVLHNLPAGDWERGDRGIACDPNRVGEFQDGVGRAIEYAEALSCRQLNCLVGIVPRGVAQAKAEETVTHNLKWAAPRLGARGIKLLVEPVNTYDIPGFCLSRSAQTIEVLRAAGEENLFLQYDAYHMQMMEEIWRIPLPNTRRASRMCRSPTFLAGTSPAPARSIIRFFSAISTSSATLAGLGANTNR